MHIASDAGEASALFTAVARQSIMILKTQMDHEKEVVDALMARADKGERDVYAVLSPIGLRGYVFVEGMNTDQLRVKVRDIKKAYSFIDARPPSRRSATTWCPYRPSSVLKKEIWWSSSPARSRVRRRASRRSTRTKRRSPWSLSMRWSPYL
nr:hypothetical protein [Candidatus Methanomethylophilus sp. 1R26]